MFRFPLGSVFDVAMDIRPESKTFGKWYGVELTQNNQWQLWIPPGLAHGFVVTSEIAHFHYKCTEKYHPEDEAGIRWDDPDVNIPWLVEAPIFSAKDLEWLYLNECRLANKKAGKY